MRHRHVVIVHPEYDDPFHTPVRHIFGLQFQVGRFEQEEGVHPACAAARVTARKTFFK